MVLRVFFSVFLGLLLGSPLQGAEPLLLVSQKAASSVAFYGLDGTLLATVPVGRHPHEVVLSLDGRHLYVADNGTMAIEEAGQGGNTVSILEIRSRRKIGEISLGPFYRPHGMDVRPGTRQVLVSTENPDRLLLVDPETRRVLRTYDPQGVTSHIVTASPDGRWAYVSNSRSGTVAAIQLESGQVSLLPSGERPEGSAISRDGRWLYVANRDSNTIAILDLREQKRVGEIPTGKGPVRLVLTADEKFLVCALHGERRVSFVEIAGRREVARLPLEGAPVSMQRSRDGQWALTAAQEADTVYRISIAERKLVRSFPVAPGSGPDPVLLVEEEGRTALLSPIRFPTLPSGNTCERSTPAGGGPVPGDGR